MRLSDINGQDGPFWPAYQETRRRDRIVDNPDTVPFWYLAKIARDRLAAARVALEQFGSLQSELEWQALRRLENRIRSFGMPDDDSVLIVLGILGAQEIEIERENAEFNDGVGA